MAQAASYQKSILAVKMKVSTTTTDKNPWTNTLPLAVQTSTGVKYIRVSAHRTADKSVTGAQIESSQQARLLKIEDASAPLEKP